MDGIILGDTRRWVRAKKCNNIGLMTPSKRTLILDDVIFSGNIVVTGVAFKRYSNIPHHERRYPESMEVREKDPFFLSVIGHGLDNEENLMANNRLEMSIWDYSLAHRTNLINDEMDPSVAVMIPHKNDVISKPKENYVTFDLAKPNKGLRQFVIPYVDSQKVTDFSYPQFVKGIGLYYKGFPGFGGYVAPSIFVPLH
ncbi:uncharacterized protein [Chelonus insularis]|uniref:uncharacterized protein n=1 Tax=Chelonus insularis TaxID=460826 RepID=UPI00158E8924|nr:uncharacterized protein LOC118069586 [Chelonus insularis]